MPFEKRKQEPGLPPRNTGPGPARPASRFFRTGAAGQIPLDVARNGSKTCNAYMASVGPSSGFKDGRSPPISTCKVRSKATPSGLCPSAGGGSQVSGKLLHSEDQITERLRPVSSFTIPPTEEDLKQLQYGQDKNGQKKKSPNAFNVWHHIHYQYARRQNCPKANMITVSIVLSREWSKLSNEQKKPYYELAHKLKCMQEQQIHDSVLLQRKKKDIECLSSRQGAGQDPGISFSQAVPPALSNVKGPMYPYPPTMPYGLPTFPISSNLYSSVQNNHLDTQNTSSFTEEVRNYHSTHHRGTRPHQSLTQPDKDTKPQCSAINKVECKCVDDGVI